MVGDDSLNIKVKKEIIYKSLNEFMLKLYYNVHYLEL